MGATSVLQAPRHVQKETGVLGLVANYHRGRLWKPSVPRPRGGEKRCCWLPSRQEGGGVPAADVALPAPLPAPGQRGG